MNRQNIFNIIKKYYLDESHNFIILCTLFLNVFYLLKLITPLETMLTDLDLLFTSISITGAALGILNIKKKQIKDKFDYKATEEDKKEPFFISRDSYLEKLRKAKGCLFVLGESGTGKSCLLDQLEKLLCCQSIHCVSIKNNYFESWQSLNDAEYIIFDQFEKILDISDPLRKIRLIEKLDDGNRTIILSLRKEYFAEIYKMFKNNEDYLWIEYNKKEQAQIITQLYNLIGEENIFEKLSDTLINDEQRVDELYSKIMSNEIHIELTLLKQIILDVIDNKILTIQLSYLGRILQQNNNGIQQVENDWAECRDYNILITHYIEKKIDNYIHSDIAYLILFLLCQDTKGIYANMEDDFENISLQSKDDIRSTLKYLEELQLIKKPKSDDNQRNLNIVQYEVSHDYILDILFTLCNNKLDINIRNNIIFYNREYQAKRNEYSVQNKSHKNDFISKEREKYVKSKDTGLYILLGIMLFTILGINSYFIWFCPHPDDRNTYLRLFFTNITTTVSTYYIFNYYHYFMRIFSYRYWSGVIFAMFSVIISYLCADYWLIGYGFDICVVGLIMRSVSRKARISEKSFFKDRCRNFCAIGAIIIVLSYYYYQLYTRIDLILALPCYLLYAVYMLAGITGHINKPYILALLGKVLYKDRKDEFK